MVPFTTVGSELIFEVFSEGYERGSTLITSNLPFYEWTSVFGSVRLTGALLDRLIHHVHILEMNGDSYRLAVSRKRQRQYTKRHGASRGRATGGGMMATRTGSCRLALLNLWLGLRGEVG